MPTITDAHVLRVKTLVKQGDIEKARTLLKTFNDPRAAKILAQLNSHHPDPNEPSPGQEVEQAKALMAQGDYAGAQRLLMTSDDPRADVLLKRINEMPGTPTPVSVPTPTKRKGAVSAVGSGCGRLVRTTIVAIAALFVCMAIYGGMTGMVNDGKKIMATEQQERQDEARATFELVCVLFLTDNYPQAESDAIESNCRSEGAYLQRNYASEIDACYFTYSEDVDRFFACLDSKGVSFSTTFQDLVDRAQPR